MITVAQVDAVLAEEIIIAFSAEHEPYLKKLSFQPSSRKYIVWSYDPAIKGMTTRHFDYVHMAVDHFNKEIHV